MRIIIKIINGIWPQEENFIMRCTMHIIMMTMIFLQIGNQKLFVKYYVSMYNFMEFSVVDTVGDYKYVNNITVTENSRKKYILYFII